ESQWNDTVLFSPAAPHCSDYASAHELGREFAAAVAEFSSAVAEFSSAGTLL
ncbi:MAG: UDP-N-acetylmuramoylalanine-D-glutamate ligase, partial [Pirellulaceae bacterium]